MFNPFKKKKILPTELAMKMAGSIMLSVGLKLHERNGVDLQTEIAKGMVKYAETRHPLKPKP